MISPDTQAFKVYMPEGLVNKIDKEVVRRRGAKLNRGPDGKRVQVSRSTILRELVEAASFPK